MPLASPPPTSSACTNEDTALRELHVQYRALLAKERETVVLERQLWENERSSYERRIAVLEAQVARLIGQGPAVEDERIDRKGVVEETKGKNGGEEGEEGEISDHEVQQLLKEAQRLVYPMAQTSPRMKGYANKEEATKGARNTKGGSGDEGDGEEEIVELKLRKTSNFGREYGTG